MCDNELDFVYLSGGFKFILVGNPGGNRRRRGCNGGGGKSQCRETPVASDEDLWGWAVAEA